MNRNRMIAGTLLAIRNSGADDYDFRAFFQHRMPEFLTTPQVATFAILLAAQLTGQAMREEHHWKKAEDIGLDLPAAAEANPDILAAFRILLAVMNSDVQMATTLTDLVTKSRGRAYNVLACMLGLLIETPRAQAA